MTDSNTDTQAISKPKSLEEIRDYLTNCKSADDPESVLKKADLELANAKLGVDQPVGAESNIFKSMTLQEFENGILLTIAVPEQFKSFGIDFMRNLQREYNCQTPSEKATAELAAINYIRTLDVERKINNYLVQNAFTDIGVRYVAVLSKELDRANRHYLASIQALKNLKQPPFQLTLKANTAVVGQNQIVTSNTNE